VPRAIGLVAVPLGWPPAEASLEMTALAAGMPHFLLTFGDARRPPVGAVLIEAPSMFQARVTAVVQRVAPDVPFGEGLTLSAEDAAIRTVILGALRGDPEGGECNFDALSAMRQAETIAKALKVCGYEIGKISR
jgi:hypothetical protein